MPSLTAHTDRNDLRKWQPGRGWVTPKTVLTCPCCEHNLISVDALRQAVKGLQPPPFWRADTRRLTVRCAGCKHFHMVFTYPLFNWIPPARLVAEMMLLNVFVGTMILSALSPHHSILWLVGAV